MEGWQIALAFVAIGLIVVFAEWAVIGATVVALIAAFNSGAPDSTYAGILLVAFFAYGFLSNVRDGTSQDRFSNPEQQQQQANYHRRQREDSFR